MDTSLVFYGIGVAVIALIVWFRTGNKPADSIYSSFDQFQDALAIAPDVVRAVEQLWQTDVLPKEARLGEAMQRLSEWFPDLTEQQLRTATEAGVWLLKNGMEMLDIELPDASALNGRLN